MLSKNFPAISYLLKCCRRRCCWRGNLCQEVEFLRRVETKKPKWNGWSQLWKCFILLHVGLCPAFRSCLWIETYEWHEELLTNKLFEFRCFLFLFHKRKERLKNFVPISSSFFNQQKNFHIPCYPNQKRVFRLQLR